MFKRLVVLFFLSVLVLSVSAKKHSFKRIVDEIVKEVIEFEKKKMVETASDSQVDKTFVDQGEFWERYRQHLIGSLTKGFPGPYLQVLTTPIEAYWDKDPSQLKQLADTVPFWGAYYSPSPYKLSDQYKDFVMKINVPRVVKDKTFLADYERVQREYDALSNQVQTKRTECVKGFVALNPKPVLDVYMNSCMGAMNKKIQDLQWELMFYEIQVYGIENQDLQESRVEVSEGMEYYEAQGSLATFRADAEAGRGTSLTLDVDFFDAVTKPVQWGDIKGLSTPSQLNSGAFSSLVKKNSSGFKTLTSRFTMKMKFPAYSLIRAAPGRWFRTSLIKKYQYGPFSSPIPNLFSAGGSMRLKPTAFYVVYRPELYLYMDSVDLDQFLSYGSQSSGGFFSSSSSYAIIETKRLSSDRIEVKVTSRAANPEIIAIDNELLP